MQQEEVWNHWKKVERIPETDVRWRWDIRDPLPANIKWFLAEIEEKDIEKIFVISSNDWKVVTPTFRLLDSLDSLDNNLDESHVKNILEKREIYKKDIDGLDRRFILVSPSAEGDFTIIEGNKRAVALLSIGKLIGNQIYLGVSKKIESYWWARHSH